MPSGHYHLTRSLSGSETGPFSLNRPYMVNNSLILKKCYDNYHSASINIQNADLKCLKKSGRRYPHFRQVAYFLSICSDAKTRVNAAEKQ